MLRSLAPAAIFFRREVAVWGSGSARGRGEQAEYAGSLDGLAAVVGVELGVEMLEVGLDGVDRHVQLARDFLVGEVGRQVAQDPQFALAERFGQARRLARRRCALLAGKQIQDLEEEGTVVVRNRK